MDIGVTVFLGFLIGCLIMTMGGGGGGYYLGVMTTVLGLSASAAASTSLVTALPPLLMGVVSYSHEKQINYKVGFRMMAYAAPAVIIGSIAARFIDEKLYSIIVGLILAMIGVQFVLRSLKKKRKRKNDHSQTFNKVAPGLFGSLGGLMCGIGGLSGGAPVMSGLLFMGLDFTNAAATSAFTLTGIVAMGIVCHISTGNVVWSAGIGLMIGSIIGAFVMPMLLTKLDPKKLNKYMVPILGVLLIIMGIKNMMMG